jgi:hypothetical protein
MNAHVFVGPTLAQEIVRAAVPTAEVFGPVAFGDVYRSARGGVRAIAIIDGYFERVPAVWHKEILWALSQGVHVLGASSLGALRAAELADFGMRGVGKIYEAYRSGALEDDDEVTIAHGPAEGGYKAHSDAMVNLRATMARAVSESVVPQATADRLMSAAKQRFYGERTFSAMLRDAERQGVSQSELAALRDWLPNNRVDQKAEDARLLLQELAGLVRSDAKPLKPNFRFEQTDAWLAGTRAADGAASMIPGRVGADHAALLEELKISGVFPAIRGAAALRWAALDEARRASFHPDLDAVAQAAEALRRDLGLVQRDAFEAWRKRERIEDASLVGIFEDEARVRWASAKLEPACDAYLADTLRVRGEYGALAEKVDAKARVLGAFGPRGPSLDDLAATETELWRWYFCDRLGRSVPSDLHLFARGAGFAGVDEMRAAALRDLTWERSNGNQGRDGPARG